MPYKVTIYETPDSKADISILEDDEEVDEMIDMCKRDLLNEQISTFIISRVKGRS